MSTFDGSGVLGMLGEDPIPRGTPDELRAAGLDPLKIGSCAPRSPGVRGCQFESLCIFGQQRYGGFKGKGPRYVGYSLITIEGTAKRDTITCHGFIRALLNRMRAGNQAREEGKPHESIRIVAQEGEEIEVNPFEQVDPDDKKITAAIRRNPKVIKVPRHPRPADNPQVTFEQRLWAEENVRRKFDPEFSGPAPNEPDIDRGGFDMEPAGDAGPEAPPAKQTTGSTPIAEPVLEGKKK